MKQAKPSTKRVTTKQRKPAPEPSKPRSDKPSTKDPVGRYMREHWGELGKDYKLEY